MNNNFDDQNSSKSKKYHRNHFAEESDENGNIPVSTYLPKNGLILVDYSVKVSLLTIALVGARL